MSDRFVNAIQNLDTLEMRLLGARDRLMFIAETLEDGTNLENEYALAGVAAVACDVAQLLEDTCEALPGQQLTAPLPATPKKGAK